MECLLIPDNMLQHKGGINLATGNAELNEPVYNRGQEHIRLMPAEDYFIRLLRKRGLPCGFRHRPYDTAGYFRPGIKGIQPAAFLYDI